MTKLEVIYKHPSEIHPYKHNAKLHPKEQIEQIKNSIKEFGFNDPIAVDEDGIIIEGHGRHIAAQEMQLEEIPVIVLSGLTDQQKKAYILAHNKLTMNTGFDIEILSDELEKITEFDMGDFGFLDEEMEELGEDEKTPEDVIEDDVPDTPEESVTQLGDIYKLGNHYLMCGDSTKEEDVQKLMGEEKADLVVTDPPYNVAIGDKWKLLNDKMMAERGVKYSIEENIIGDKGMTDEECGEKLWKPAFTNMLQFSNDRCSIYCFMPQGGTHMMMMMMMRDAGWQVKHELIWVKDQAIFSMGRLDYDYQHEPILYGWNKNHAFYSERNEKSVFEDEKQDFEKMKKEELVKILRNIFDSKTPISVFKENKVSNSGKVHPTMKPIKLLARLIRNSSRTGEIVMDLFGGSGSTLIACEQMGRKCRTMELDPKYCDVIVDRWEKLTGKKAELLRKA